MLDKILGLGSQGTPQNTAPKSNNIFDFSDPQKAAAWKMISNGTTPSVGAPRPMFQGVGDAYSQAQTAQTRAQDMEMKKQDRAQKVKSKNMTRQWLTDNNHHDILQGLDTGVFSMADAAKMGMKREEEARAKEKENAQRAQQIEYLRKNGATDEQLVAVSMGLTSPDDIYKGSQGSDSYQQVTGAEAQAMGLDPNKIYNISPDDKVSVIGGGVNVEVNNAGGPDKYHDESGKLAAQRFDEISKNANNAGELRGQIDQLNQMSALIGTGKSAEFLNVVGPYAQAIGIDIEGLDAIQAFDSITSKLAPQMRPVGSGSSSDKDVEMFLRSLPSLGNTPEGNQIIAGTFDAVLENKMRAAELVKLTYIPREQGGLDWWEAEQLIQQLPNPYEIFLKSGATDGTSLDSLSNKKSKYGLE